MNPLVSLLMLISQTLAKRSEVILAFAVIGIVFMMIMPLPTGLVDALIALNICISLLLVVMAMHLTGPVAFSTFPAVLLVTTLFRLALSITTTRLILLDADAGDIVEAFGNFVVGGNLVVGLVIFLILLIVNFLVITKGAERIAEVSARFTLDAMPGKQMSQLFGAMDGAMKFVKGDAIAGLIIVMVNILGGVSIGVTQMELTAGEALELFAILTIGDGLVAQIPALLIALTAGLITTRVKADALAEDNVGQEMSYQLTLQPKAWIISSIVMLFFALVPGMPAMAFVFLAMFFSFVGGCKIYLTNRAASMVQDELTEEETAADQTPPEEEDVRSFSVYERLSAVLHTKHKDSDWFMHFRRSLRKSRNEIVINYAYVLPTYKFHFSDEVGEDEFLLRFYEAPVVNATYGSAFAWVGLEYKEKLDELSIGYTVGKEEREESHLLWVGAEHLDTIEANDIPYTTSIDEINRRATDAFMSHSHAFIGLEESHKIMNWALDHIPELAKECERLLPLAKLTDVLKKLAAESISLKSLHKIFETIVANASVEREPNALAEIVRVYLRDQICSQVTKDNKVNVCLLDANTEDTLRDSLHKTASGGYFAINSDDAEQLVGQVFESTYEYLNGNEPVALVVSQDIRPYVRDLIKNRMFKLPVLSYSEISESISVQPIARLSL